MTRIVSLSRLAVLTALLAVGCKKNPDPAHIELGDFVSGNQLNDTLRKLIPVGTRLPRVWEMMQTNGFGCGERAPTTVDLKSNTLASGQTHLECYQSTRINLGMRRRDWTVVIEHDTTGVTGINSGYIIQP
ncbi:MAG TPA: hypothetical protein VN797_05115 [Gemmatimonadaceae bacterium]|nr:hypothetical protein [Gemmatimonadaceae bacterium]